MKIFHCDHCQHLIFFENVQCVACGHQLAYLPDVAEVASLEASGDDLWRSPAPAAEGRTYRLCQNYVKESVCNWAIPADDPHPLCSSCRLTRVIPDLSQAGNKDAWYRLEAAKRRLVYSLLGLRLPLANKTDDPEHGLAYEFLADAADAGGAEGKVLTGHDDGVITISVAEADDAEREKRRLELHEPYRTLLGHFRHEVGHYYWDRLIQGTQRLDAFRQLFGDESADYGESLQAHYTQGPPADWPQRFVSAYASAHPWEDWAETWAHYLHMVDALETAAACGMSLRPRRADEPSMSAKHLGEVRAGAFDRMIDHWFALTYVLNNLNRGLGLPDGYPFTLSSAAIDKLRYVDETVASAQSVSAAVDGEQKKTPASASPLVRAAAGETPVTTTVPRADDDAAPRRGAETERVLPRGQTLKAG